MLAEALFGNPHAFIKVDCAEFQEHHEIAKLIGSPPGYIGHMHTQPILTPEALTRWHTEKLKLTLLLFDEVEKPSESLWQLMLGILDKARGVALLCNAEGAQGLPELLNDVLNATAVQ